MGAGWEITEDLNIMPHKDRREHVSGEHCWCRPTWDDGVLVHHAADGREKHETH